MATDPAELEQLLDSLQSVAPAAVEFLQDPLRRPRSAVGGGQAVGPPVVAARSRRLPVIGVDGALLIAVSGLLGLISLLRNRRRGRAYEPGAGK